MFIVTVETAAGTCYLRSTVWTFAGNRDRAREFETREAAQKQLDKARQFMKASVYKAIVNLRDLERTMYNLTERDRQAVIDRHRAMKAQQDRDDMARNPEPIDWVPLVPYTRGKNGGIWL